jgi:TIR domain
MTDTKRVFISYSHDSELHKNWVRDLATFLMGNGVEVILDQWDLDFGDDIASFMEGGIKTTDQVLLICTPSYISKANVGSGGVGYEKTILTSEILIDHRRRKRVIPIVRNVSDATKLPAFLGSVLYLDMSDANDGEGIRKELLRRIDGLQKRKPELGVKPYIPEAAPSVSPPPQNEFVPELGAGKLSSMFHDRFAQAFPGVRGVAWFSDTEVVAQRLGILLASPLVFNEVKHLAWWWRGLRNLQIENFEHLEGPSFLMDHYELKIRRVAAVNAGEYYQSLVYVEAEKDVPTGLYDCDGGSNSRTLQIFGYNYEEYGLVDGVLPVTRAEFDDGATVIDGMPVDIRDRVELRTRYLSSYNFIIAPHMSPINNPSFDRRAGELLKRMLQGEEILETEFLSEYLRLPKRY